MRDHIACGPATESGAGECRGTFRDVTGGTCQGGGGKNRSAVKQKKIIIYCRRNNQGTSPVEPYQVLYNKALCKMLHQRHPAQP